jgi:DNA-binding transcriptional ArsR family regulator
MNAEPYSIRQQFGTRILPAKVAPPQTPYASYPEAYLAKLLADEAVAVRKRQLREGLRSNMSRAANSGLAKVSPDRVKRQIVGRGLAAAMAIAADREKVFAALTKPMPISALCMLTGLNRYEIGGHLSAMRNDGLVTKIRAKGKNAAIWHRGQE